MIPLKEVLERKLVRTYRALGFDIEYFDELSSQEQMKFLALIDAEEDEIYLLVYKNPQETILISSKGIYFLNRQFPRKLLYANIEAFEPELTTFKVLLENGECSKEEYLKNYTMRTNRGEVYDMKFYTSDCGYFLCKCSRIIGVKLSKP